MLSRLSIPAAAAVMIVMVLACWLLTGGTSQQAFADMKEALDEIKSLAYEMTGLRDGKVQTIQVRLLGKDLMRAEHSTGETIVVNLEQGLMLELKPRKKHAIITNNLASYPRQINLFEYLADPAAKATKELPGRVINGVETIGFRVDVKPIGAFDVYVDPKTKLPMRVEIEAQKGKRPVVFNKFVFNPRVDESAFNTTPPDDYTIEHKDLGEQRKALIKKAKAEALRKHKEALRSLQKARKQERDRANTDAEKSVD